MLHAVWLQSDLFPYRGVPSYDRSRHSGMEDLERDNRTGSQWLRAVYAYLEFRTGDAWRRGSTRQSPVRWYYLDAIRFLNGLEARQPRKNPDCITPKTIKDIRIGSLASWPVARLVTELMRLNPALTDRRILTHLSRVKLARMLLDARVGESARLERAG